VRRCCLTEFDLAGNFSFRDAPLEVRRTWRACFEFIVNFFGFQAHEDATLLRMRTDNGLKLLDKEAQYPAARAAVMKHSAAPRCYGSSLIVRSRSDQLMTGLITLYVAQTAVRI
jgi:hypothetical protein